MSFVINCCVLVFILLPLLLLVTIRIRIIIIITKGNYKICLVVNQLWPVVINKTHIIIKH